MRLTAAALLLPALLLPAQAQTTPAPAAAFTNPPADARPMVRWWWFGPAVEKPEILREVQQMKADGIGGAELAFVYPQALDDPATGLKNFDFLSREMLDAVTYAKDEGRKLGLRIDVTLCSGWPYGGPATTLAEAAGRLRVAEVAVPAGSTALAAPTLAEGDSFLSAALVEGSPTPAPVRRGSPASPPASTWNAATAQALQPAATSVPAAAKPRVALYFIASHTRQQVKRAAVGAEGYVLDPFSKAAVATHLRAVGEPLVKAFGTTPPYAIFSDSLEAYGADWTPTLPAEFKRRRGYDLLPRLPELIAGGTPAAANLRHDYGRTLTELVNENYLTQINDWAHTHGTQFRSQTYGEPAVSFSSQNLVDLAEGEGPQWRQFSTLRWATSANHVFSRNVTSGETFTWLHSPVFRATPLDMKAEADIDFLMGENQLIFHGWPYSPPQASATGEPGWNLYAAAVFNDHNPWHPVMPAVTQYITRVSGLLRQGEPANQVAVLLPTDDAWAQFAPGHVTVTGAMQTLIPPAMIAAILDGVNKQGAGYNFDFIDAAAIERVGLGTHTVVVLPPTDRIPLATVTRLQAFVKGGGKVLALGRSPSLLPDGTTSPEFAAVLAALFPAVVPNAAALPEALFKAANPDLLLVDDGSIDETHPATGKLGFIHRVQPDRDVFFVANTSNQPVLETVQQFQTRWQYGSAVDPDTGRATTAYSNCQPLKLAPYESRIFIFTRDLAPGQPQPPVREPLSYICVPISPGKAKPLSRPARLLDLSAGWSVKFGGQAKTVQMATLKDWATDPATRNYSGEAVYTRDFTLARLPAQPVLLEVSGGAATAGAPGAEPTHVLGADGLPNPLITRTGPGMHAYYDPPLREAALVFINGKPAGALWHPPYQLDLSPYLHAGVNHLEIRVYNTALNAWSALPPHDYGSLKAKYGDRFQMQDLDKVQPLPSGLLGAVRLVLATP